MRNLNCVRCLLILQRHYNVLQYRQTYCYPRGKLDAICLLLNSDENLHSMFRADANPIACPFRGSYEFAYNSGGLAECSSPMSSAERCAEESELLLRFQACADVKGTESRVEKLTCLATWKDGLLSYVIGKMEHALVSSDNDRYRCFVYEILKGKKGMLRISQSPDATCYGLHHSNAGSRIMQFTKVRDEPSRCRFPEWVTKYRHWKTLDMSHSYIFSHKNKSLFITEHPVFLKNKPNLNNKTLLKHRITKIRCIEEFKNLPSLTTSVVHVTSGCSNGYQCMKIHRRRPHIIQITTGKMIRSKEAACMQNNVESYESKTVTLVETAHTRHSRCPNFIEDAQLSLKIAADRKEKERKLQNKTNAFQKREVCNDYSSVKLGCEAGHTLNFEFDCVSPIPVTKFNCHGHWYEEGITYLVTTLHDSDQKVCLTYSSHNGKINVSGRNNCVNHSANVKGARTLFSLNAHVLDSCRGGVSSLWKSANSMTLVAILLLLHVTFGSTS